MLLKKLDDIRIERDNLTSAKAVMFSGVDSREDLEKEKDKLDIIYFDIVDISHNSSTLITLGGKETELAEIAFNAKANNHLLLLPAIVSRKGQLLPMITKALR